MTLIQRSAAAAIAAALILSGASAFAVTIGFSQVGDEGDWRPAFSKDMQEEAKKEGIDLKFNDAHGNPEEQLKAVRAFIAAKVDAIVIAPVVVTGWDAVLQEARKAAVPIFLADRDVDVTDKSLYVTRIAADFNLEGRNRRRLAGGGEPRQLQYCRTARNPGFGAGHRAQEGVRDRHREFPEHEDCSL